MMVSSVDRKVGSKAELGRLFYAANRSKNFNVIGWKREKLFLEQTVKIKFDTIPLGRW